LSQKQELFGKAKTEQEVEEEAKLELEKEILLLARNMKSAAQNLNLKLASDNPLLQTISVKQQKHLESLKKETTRLQAIQVKTSFWNTIKTFFSVILAFVIFLTMMILIRTFPSKTYVYLNAN